MAKRIKSVVDGDLAIVPIPNSTATVDSDDEFRTLELARGIADAIGKRATAVAALRWKVATPPAHIQGGPRIAQRFYDNLRIVEEPDRPIIIFDDVLTSGGHMRAAYRRLRKAKLAPAAGFVVGMTTYEQEARMIQWRRDEIETRW